MNALDTTSTTIDAAEHVPLGGSESEILTEDEVARAIEIKQAVEKELHLNNLTDFEYVQYALAHPSDSGDTSMGTVLQHMQALQCFCEEYNLHDTVEEGLELFEASTQQHPGLFLAVEYLPESGNFITIDDWPAFFPAQVHSAKNRRILMGSLYYRYNAVCSTFLAIRQGIAAMAECEGCSFQNLDPTLHEAVMIELFHCYPKKHREILFLNSPTAVNVAHALWTRYMTPNMKDAFRLGYQIQGMEGRRIDGLFKTPTEEIARQQMLQKVKSFLQLRYRNQTTFRLPSSR